MLAYRQACPTPWLKIDIGGSNLLWVVLLPRQVALGCVRKQAEQAMCGCFSMFLHGGFALISLHDELWYATVNWDKSWSPQVAFGYYIQLQQ